MTTKPNRQARFVFFLILAIIGLVTAMVFNGIASVQGQNYLDAWFGSAADWVLSLDILIVAIAGSALMIMDATRLGMKRVWLYIVVSGVTAFAFTLPLFLAMRERKLSQIEAQTS